MRNYLISFFTILCLSCQFNSSNKLDKTYIAITFDDGFADVYENAMPIMKEYDIRATNFVCTGHVGKDNYMTWNQIEKLEFEYGWETGGHTFNHAYLPDKSDLEARYQIEADWNNLVNKGLSHQSFAIPCGAATPRDYQIILDYYENIRNSHEPRLFYPIDCTNIGYFAYITSFTSNDIIARIFEGIANRENLIVLGFHRIMEEDGNNPYNCKTNEFEEIIEFIASENLEVITIKEASEILGNK